MCVSEFLTLPVPGVIKPTYQTYFWKAETRNTYFWLNILGTSSYEKVMEFEGILSFSLQFYQMV